MAGLRRETKSLVRRGSLLDRIFLMVVSERQPRDGHREMKLAVMRLWSFLSRQQTLCRVRAAAPRILHCTPPFALIREGCARRTTVYVQYCSLVHSGPCGVPTFRSRSILSRSPALAPISN